MSNQYWFDIKIVDSAAGEPLWSGCDYFADLASVLQALDEATDAVTAMMTGDTTDDESPHHGPRIKRRGMSVSEGCPRSFTVYLRAEEGYWLATDTFSLAWGQGKDPTHALFAWLRDVDDRYRAWRKAEKDHVIGKPGAEELVAMRRILGT